jgi:hypothetical protein
MKKNSNLLKTGIFLIFLSFLLHALHYAIFRDLKHIFVYLLGDIAFIPLEVFIVTLVIDQLLEKREKQDRMKKLNMLIGLFYQEVGLLLLKTFAHTDPQIAQLKMKCHVTHDWQDDDFRKLEKQFTQMDKKVDVSQVHLEDLRLLLGENKTLMINLISNPSLVEHETFSELLMAVSHLQDELQLREKTRKKYPEYDNADHLKVDIERVYGHLLFQWLYYIEHLKSDYPFLFATAMATNPFETSDLLLNETT